MIRVAAAAAGGALVAPATKRMLRSLRASRFDKVVHVARCGMVGMSAQRSGAQRSGAQRSGAQALS